jgi:hypothetical protein
VFVQEPAEIGCRVARGRDCEEHDGYSESAGAVVRDEGVPQVFNGL